MIIENLIRALMLHVRDYGIQTRLPKASSSPSSLRASITLGARRVSRSAGLNNNNSPNGAGT